MGLPVKSSTLYDPWDQKGLSEKTNQTTHTTVPFATGRKQVTNSNQQLSKALPSNREQHDDVMELHNLNEYNITAIPGHQREISTQTNIVLNAMSNIVPDSQENTIISLAALKQTLPGYAPEMNPEALNRIKQREGIIELSYTILEMLYEYKQAEISCDGSCKDILRVTTEGVTFIMIYLLATANQYGITGDVDFSNPEDILNKSVAFLAGISTGSIYTGAAVKIYDRFKGFIKDNWDEGFCKKFTQSIRSCRNHPLELIKNVTMIPISLWAVKLDTENTKTGTYDLLKKIFSDSQADIISTALSFGNGFSQILLPLVTLPVVFKTTFAPLKGVFTGSNYTRSELRDFEKLLVKLALDAEGNRLNANKAALKRHITDIISKKMNHSQRSALQDDLEKVVNNSANFLGELVSYLNNESTGSIRTRLKSSTAVLIQFTMITLEISTIGALISANQKMRYYTHELNNRNLTLDMLRNATLANEFNNLTEQYGIPPYDQTTDILNLGSYACQGLVMYPYLFFTASTILEFARSLLTDELGKLFDDPKLFKKLFFFAVSMLATGSYIYNVSGAISIKEQITDLERMLGIDTSVFPDFPGQIIITYIMIASILLSGSFLGVSTLAKYMPKSQCSKKEVDSLDFDSCDSVSTKKTEDSDSENDDLCRDESTSFLRQGDRPYETNVIETLDTSTETAV